MMQYRSVHFREYQNMKGNKLLYSLLVTQTPVNCYHYQLKEGGGCSYCSLSHSVQVIYLMISKAESKCSSIMSLWCKNGGLHMKSQTLPAINHSSAEVSTDLLLKK